MQCDGLTDKRGDSRRAWRVTRDVHVPAIEYEYSYGYRTRYRHVYSYSGEQSMTYEYVPVVATTRSEIEG
eukprot:scaffold83575_cov20-Prasinocladus_malaysianus.AAC.1